METDPKPLESITHKPLNIARSRLQSLLLDVPQYAPKITCKKSREQVTEDLLDRDWSNNEGANNYSQDVELLAIVPMSP